MRYKEEACPPTAKQRPDTFPLSLQGGDYFVAPVLSVDNLVLHPASTVLRDDNPSPTIYPRAGVVELVDTWDLKSHGALPRAGSSPASGIAETAFPDVVIPS